MSLIMHILYTSPTTKLHTSVHGEIMAPS